MKILRVLLAGVVGLLSCGGLVQAKGSSLPVNALSIFNHNLLVNGNAEASYDDSKQVPGWQPIEGFSVDKYGSVGSEWDYGLSGCPSCKDYYLRLEFEGSVHELSTSQKVNIAVAASQVDAGEVKATISAYLGAFIGADTSSEIIAVYQDASGKELGRTATQQYNTNTLAKAEKGSTGLILCEASGMVPVGTRTIVYIWKAEATGESNSYLALGDNFSLKLSPSVPEAH